LAKVVGYFLLLAKLQHMSHGRERKEKNCLNCNARVFGRYCHVCGQENAEPKESAWDLIVHFFNDITHFEGKFLTSLRYLVFKPGFLTAEYVRGRRASYMNPVRMYVFTSAFFFILFFTFFSESSHKSKKANEHAGEVTMNEPAVNPQEQALKNVDTKKDSALVQQVVPTAKDGDLHINFDSTGRGFIKYKSIAEYDSIQQTLPADKKSNWFERAMAHRLIKLKEIYGNDWKTFANDLVEYVMHSLPKMLFVSLPFFALIFSLLYIRHKQSYYVGHLIFTIHLFVFAFLFLLTIFSLGKLQDTTGWSFGWLKFILWMLMFVYLYKAMRRVYQQGRGKTILKFVLLLFLTFVLNIFLFTAFFSYSFFNM
jgi:hypothetical protein